MGRRAWKLLHETALAGQITLDWLAVTFLPLVPAFGCACRREWLDLLQAIPFREHDQFAWSVEIHNAVNTKLHKPCLTAAQALQHWSPAPPK